MDEQKEKEITRNDFMNFFRDNDKLNLLSTDDRIEVFSTIRLGSSDFKIKIFENIFSDYCVSHIGVLDLQNIK